MRRQRRAAVGISILTVTGLLAAGPVGAGGPGWVPGRIYVGPPPYPNPNATDNGIPGTGAYAYRDYNWPSLRQALDTYGWFGRKVPRRGCPVPGLLPPPGFPRLPAPRRRRPRC